MGGCTLYELLSTGSVAAVRAQGREEWARTGQKERGQDLEGEIDGPPIR